MNSANRRIEERLKTINPEPKPQTQPPESNVEKNLILPNPLIETKKYVQSSFFKPTQKLHPKTKTLPTTKKTNKIHKIQNSPLPNDVLIPLNQKKRDLRSIEEIMLDIKAKKHKCFSPDLVKTKNNLLKQNQSDQSVSATTVISNNNQLSNLEPNFVKKNQQSSSAFVNDSSKRQEEKYCKNNYSSIISQIFPLRNKISNENNLSDDSDMESSLFEIELEEALSRKSAIEEDRKEQELSRVKRISK